MKNIQRQLPFPVVSVSKDKDQVEKRRRHLLIAGRPRRLKSELKIESWEEVQKGLVGKLEITEDFVLGEAGKGSPIGSCLDQFLQKPEVIKVAIPPRVVSALDQIRTRLAGNATRPEIVRGAVKEFVDAHKHLIGKVAKDGREKRHGLPGRCQYLKVPFSPDVVDAIGYQAHGRVYGEDEFVASTGLCLVFGTTRQGVISRGLSWWLERNK